MLQGRRFLTRDRKKEKMAEVFLELYEIEFREEGRALEKRFRERRNKRGRSYARDWRANLKGRQVTY